MDGYFSDDDLESKIDEDLFEAQFNDFYFEDDGFESRTEEELYEAKFNDFYFEDDGLESRTDEIFEAISIDPNFEDHAIEDEIFEALSDDYLISDVVDNDIFSGVQFAKSCSETDLNPKEQNFTNLFVKNFADALDTCKLKRIFQKFGPITSAKVETDENGRSKGFGFVCFENSTSAKRAVQEMNGSELKGRKLYVGQALKKSEREIVKGVAQNLEKTNVYVKNLTGQMDDEGLRRLFEPFGVIRSTKVMKYESGKSKKFGFVNFTKTDEATRAIEQLNDQVLKPKGKPLYVSFVQSLAERKRRLEENKIKAEIEMQKVKEDEVQSQTETVSPDSIEKAASSVSECYKTETESVKITEPMLRCEKSRKKLENLRESEPEMVKENLQKTLNSGKTVYVKNLNGETDDEELRKLFEPFGSIKSTKLMRNVRGKSKRFGFVSFIEIDEATRAIAQLNGQVLKPKGKPLFVSFAERKRLPEENEIEMQKVKEPKVQSEVAGAAHLHPLNVGKTCSGKATEKAQSSGFKYHKEENISSKMSELFPGCGTIQDEQKKLQAELGDRECSQKTNEVKPKSSTKNTKIRETNE